MKKFFIIFVLIIGIGGLVSENVHAEIWSKVAKTAQTVVIHGPDSANLALELTVENAVGMVGDGVGSYAGGAGGGYIGAAVGTAICLGQGTVVGRVIGYWGGVFGGGYVGEKVARIAYHQLK
ncbi:MAG: hypothetical protein LBJ67_04815 [Planctomycetaceae bacterium]|nr:hypothetical protein [Planctomycetaceae bacterium]